MKSTVTSPKCLVLCISMTTLLMPMQTAIGAFEHTDKNKELYTASKYGYKKIVEKLLKTGADKNSANSNGCTPLHAAAKHGHATVVELLLKAGANKDVQHKNGWMPLHYAAHKGHGAVVKLLLKANADKDAQHKNGWTSLYVAARNGHEGVVEVLLTAGADKNAHDRNYWTPLHIAAYQGYATIVDLLIKARADIEREGQSGTTALFSSFVALLKKPKTDAYLKIAYMLILMGNASLEKLSTFSLKDQNRLKALGFDKSTVLVTVEMSKILLKEHCQASINHLESLGIPNVIAQLIIEYHRCFDTHMLLFIKAKTSGHTLLA